MAGELDRLLGPAGLALLSVFDAHRQLGSALSIYGSAG